MGTGSCRRWEGLLAPRRDLRKAELRLGSGCTASPSTSPRGSAAGPRRGERRFSPEGSASPGRLLGLTEEQSSKSDPGETRGPSCQCFRSSDGPCQHPAEPSTLSPVLLGQRERPSTPAHVVVSVKTGLTSCPTAETAETKPPLLRTSHPSPASPSPRRAEAPRVTPTLGHTGAHLPPLPQEPARANTAEPLDPPRSVERDHLQLCSSELLTASIARVLLGFPRPGGCRGRPTARDLALVACCLSPR